MNTPLKPGIRALLGLVAATRIQYDRARGKAAEDPESIEAFAKLERAAMSLVDELEQTRARMDSAAELLDRVRFAFPSADDRTAEVIEEREGLDARRESIGAAALAFDQAFAEVSRITAPAKSIDQVYVVAPGSDPPPELVAKYGEKTMRALTSRAIPAGELKPAATAAAGGNLDAHLAGLEGAWASAPVPARGGSRARAKPEPADAGPLFADPNAPPI